MASADQKVLGNRSFALFRLVMRKVILRKLLLSFSMKSTYLSLILLLWLGFLSSCGESNDDPIAPVDTFESGLTGMLNGQTLSVNSAGIQSALFIDAGESFGALEIGAQLPNSERLTFFVQEAKPGQISLTQAFPAVMGAHSTGLRTNAPEEKADGARLQSLPSSFVKYLSSNQTYFAIAGTLTLKLEGKNLTLTWEISFKDKNGNTFTSTGTVKVKNFDSIKKAKSEINPPTSNLSIATLTPDYVKAGDEVTLTGTGFSALKSENTVTLGTAPVTIVEATATSLKVTVPQNAVHGKFKVAVLSATAESGEFFFAPILTGLDKTAAQVGQTVVIQGNHFDADKSKLQVKLGEQVLPIQASTYTAITVEIPQGTKTGKISVARVGKAAVLGPELTIEVPGPVTTGPPINEIFEVVSGNLTFEEIFTNNSQYGSVWHLFMDQKKNFLYAVTADYLLQINLSNRAVKVIAGPESLVFKRDINGLAKIPTTPPAFFAAADGMIYGYRSGFAAILSTSNVFKINPETGVVTSIGSVKVDSGASMASMFVDGAGNLYFNEFANGYRVNSYDASMQNKKELIPSITGEMVSGFIQTGDNSFRVSRGLLISGTLNKYLYHDVNANQASAASDWTPALGNLRPSVAHSTPLMIGLAYTQGNFYGFATAIQNSDDRPYANYPKLIYTIGVQAGGQGNFVKKGEFTIIQKFVFGSEPRYMRAYPQSSYRNAFATDAEGNAYILLTSPLNPSTGTEIVTGLGGIYRVKL